MPRVCTICTHPEHDAIDAALVGEVANRRIAPPAHVAGVSLVFNRTMHARLWTIEVMTKHDECMTQDDAANSSCVMPFSPSQPSEPLKHDEHDAFIPTSSVQTKEKEEDQEEKTEEEGQSKRNGNNASSASSASSASPGPPPWYKVPQDIDRVIVRAYIVKGDPDSLAKAQAKIDDFPDFPWMEEYIALNVARGILGRVAT